MGPQFNVSSERQSIIDWLISLRMETHDRSYISQFQSRPDRQKSVAGSVFSAQNSAQFFHLVPRGTVPVFRQTFTSTSHCWNLHDTWRLCDKAIIICCL